MKWKTMSSGIPERNPNKRYSQVPCLVYHRGEVKILVFNHEHTVWDQEDYDDYYCDIGDVSHWMPLPAPPTADNVEGANLQHTTEQVQNG